MGRHVPDLAEAIPSDNMWSAAGPVDRIALGELSQEVFWRRYRAASLPVVITDVFAAGTDWTLDYLCEQLGAARYHARHYGKDQFTRPIYEWQHYSQLIELAVSDYAAMLRDRRAHQNNVYLAQVDVGGTEAGRAIRPAVDALAARTGMSPLLKSDLNIWLGPSGHTEPLHFDPGDGTLMQLHGAKRVVLFPPRATADLYPFPVAKGAIPPWVSQVTIRRPDFERFPRLRHALPQCFETTIDIGDVIFIPAYWWHEVTALGDDYVCSVNRFWKPPARRNLVHGRAMMMATMNRLPFKYVLAADRVIRWLRH
jgi:lysine-specific demethylase 8/hypoxia-inducible factor 1-alpha inhibitor (HIF hydroxylase)